MSKSRPCKKACGYPALKGRQFCVWHVLMRSSSHQQAEAAADRREDQLGHDNAIYQARVPKEIWPDGERWCAGCQSFVPLFYTTGSRCKACASSAAHAGRVERVYGISSADYDALYKRQGGRCAICRNRSRTIRFAVDHDHLTGAVRGLLCKRCNHDLLGGGHDDLTVLFAAIRYLIFPPAQQDGPEPSNEDVLRAVETRLRHLERLAARPSVQAPF